MSLFLRILSAPADLSTGVHLAATGSAVGMSACAQELASLGVPVEVASWLAPVGIYLLALGARRVRGWFEHTTRAEDAPEEE